MKININKPCPENWDMMSLAEKGRFCDVCSKNVHDFTMSSDEEMISEIFKNKNICGKFNEEQLNRNLHFSQINSLFATFAMGLCLTSAGFVSAQTVDSSAVVDHTVKSVQTIILGSPSYQLYGSKQPLYIINRKISTVADFRNLNPRAIKKVEVVKDKAATDKYGEQGKNGVILIFTKKRFVKYKKK